MRSVTLLVLAALVALGACSIPGHKVEKVVADKDFVKKQRDTLFLLHQVHQHSLIKEVIQDASQYDLEANINNYEDPTVVKHFLSYYKKGLLHRGEPFSVSYKVHRDQAVLLFKLLYWAKDYDTFYKTACWARERLNQGLFIYSYSIALFHREDTKDIIIPPPYEIYPYLFVDHDIIQVAGKYRMKDSDVTESHHHVIQWNHTVHNKEEFLNYFREDVNLNTFYLFYHYYYPNWLNFTQFGITFDRQGEQFFYIHHQIYARYILERLSNDLPDIEPFSFWKAIKTPYNPHLRYQNGDEMPVRPANVYVTNNDLFYVSDIKHYEERLAKSIDAGFVYNRKLQRIPLYDDEHGIEILGDIVEGNWDTPHWFLYGDLFNYYRVMIGHSVDPFHQIELPPSALEHYETALRDPVFYQAWKRLEHYFQRYKRRLPRYNYEQLNFEGVKVENVDIDKLYTYFEPYEFPLNNAVNFGKIEEAVHDDLLVREYRLNHKPFNYKVDVLSDKDQDVYLRVFLGPKYDFLGNEYHLNDRRHYFVELDRFPYHVKAGKTVIERNSQDFSILASERDTSRTLYKKVQTAFEGKGEYHIDKNHVQCGYPENLLLPKGKKGGMQFTLFVMVTPYVKQDEHDFEPYGYKAFSYCGVGPNRKYPDDKPMGYPFDRVIYENEFHSPNMYFKDVIIFHKKYDEMSNVTQ